MADKPVRADKATAVAELTEHFRSSGATVLTEYRGLTVAQLTKLRRSLVGRHLRGREEHAREACCDGRGHFGPRHAVHRSYRARLRYRRPRRGGEELREFAKANPALVIKGGVFEGKAISAAEVNKLADLESREVLLAKLAGGMKANLSKAAALFQAPLSKVARTAAALQEKREKEGAEAA